MIQIPTDSLTIADTVSHGGAELFAPADSLFAADSIVLTADSLHKVVAVTAETVYGAASELVMPGVAVPDAVADFSPLTGNIFYSLAALACFFAFCLTVYYYRAYAFGIFNVLRGGATTEKILDDRSKVFGAFLVLAISLGLFITGLCVLKFADLFFEQSFAGLPGWMAVVYIFGTWGAIALTGSFQYVLLRVAGRLTLMEEFVGRLLYLKKIVVAIGTVATLPVFLLFALADGQSARVLAIMIAGIAVLLTIFLIVRTFMLFLRHNFPILLWILYFCAVEIFPVSFIAVTVVKTTG